MPLYLIERNFAERLDLTREDVELIDEINAGEDARWLFSFLSADRRRTYCLYEAPSSDAILTAARRANVPADKIVEVGTASPVLVDRLRDWAEAQLPATRPKRAQPVIGREGARRARLCGSPKRGGETQASARPWRCA